MIPATIDEAHRELERIFGSAELPTVDAMQSEDEMINYHMGLGTGMRNEWGLWGGGPLAQHMIGLGFTEPDDMTAVILATFWCKQHGMDFRLKERAADCSARAAAQAKAFAKPPATAMDPRDGSEVKWVVSMSPADSGNLRHVDIGKSKKTGLWSAYEHDKGIYIPDPELMAYISKQAPSWPS